MHSFRWKNNVEAGKKKSITDLSPRDQRQRRKYWREAYHRSKEKRETMKNVTSNTPPSSSDDAALPELPEPSPEQNTPSRLVQRIVQTHSGGLETVESESDYFRNNSQYLLIVFTDRMWQGRKESEKKEIS